MILVVLTIVSANTNNNQLKVILQESTQNIETTKGELIRVKVTAIDEVEVENAKLYLRKQEQQEWNSYEMIPIQPPLTSPKKQTTKYTFVYPAIVTFTTILIGLVIIHTTPFFKKPEKRKKGKKANLLFIILFIILIIGVSAIDIFVFEYYIENVDSNMEYYVEVTNEIGNTISYGNNTHPFEIIVIEDLKQPDNTKT